MTTNETQVRPFTLDVPQAQLEDPHHCTEPDRGGHFLAMEKPELLVADVREFFRTLGCG